MTAKNYFLSFLSLFLLLSAFGQQVRPYPMEEKALLWKVEGDPVKGEVYLFGTMHLIEKDHFLFPKKLDRIVRKSDVVVMEIAGLPDPMEAMNFILLKEGSFFDFFTPEQTDSILLWANEHLHMNEAVFRSTFDKMKPFALVQMAVQMEYIGKTESYEMTFQRIAGEAQIPLEGFETIAEQMGIFDRLTKTQQQEMVMETIRGGNEQNTLKVMQDVYGTQDVDALYGLIEAETGVLDEMENDLLANRNRNWVAQMNRYFDGRKVLIAVGAGHLGGPEGLIRLLEQQGLTLIPVAL